MEDNKPIYVSFMPETAIKFTMVSTQRLNIIPLNYDQLYTYLQAGDLFETALGLQQTGRNISATIKENITRSILPAIKNPENDDYLYITSWIVIEKSSNTIVAELGFKGPPDDAGAIEIGYGTMPGHQNRGYMTEAVAGMMEWAKQRKEIVVMLASIDETNKASLRIVEKNNFELVAKKNGLLWWKKKVRQI